MEIKLRTLILHNFKGIKDLEINFSEETTNIAGDNGTGKTTVFDAFTWLLFGKDSSDSKDFNIKTLDENNKAIPNIEHSVTGELFVDGKNVTLQRIYREKWTRRRGSEQSELTGHETEFYWDSVPIQAKEYQSRINALIDEGLFKMFSSATYFNSMKWQDRREVLVKIAGDIRNKDILDTLEKGQIKDIIEIQNSGKKFAEFRSMLSILKKKLNDALSKIPSRIDECRRSIPEPIDVNFIKSEIERYQRIISEIENNITDQIAAHQGIVDSVQQKQTEIFTLKQQIQKLQFEWQSQQQSAQNDYSLKLSSTKTKLSELTGKIDLKKQQLSSNDQLIKNIEEQIVSLREQWDKVCEQTLTIDENTFICPTCKRALDISTIEVKRKQMISNFEDEKAAELQNINSSGITLSNEELTIRNVNLIIKDAIDQLTKEQEDVIEKLKEIESAPLINTPPPTYPELNEQISMLELSVTEVPPLNIADLKSKKESAQEAIDLLKIKLTAQDSIDRGNARIKELMEEEKNLSQQISDIERQEFAMESYTKCYMNMVEQRVNSKFKIAKWKMFNYLLNGGTEPCCECLVNGVPYSDINSAAKIQVGIDCIDTLSEHYNIFTPVFIDNRESTNTIPTTKSQVINLYVTQDKSLTIK